MEHRDLVVNEMQDSGFKVRVSKQGVEVSLTNRKVSQMEVREALGQKFEGIRFDLVSNSNGVLIIV